MLSLQVRNLVLILLCVAAASSVASTIEAFDVLVKLLKC